jgi:hypothetical protein
MGANQAQHPPVLLLNPPTPFAPPTPPCRPRQSPRCVPPPLLRHLRGRAARQHRALLGQLVGREVAAALAYAVRAVPVGCLGSAQGRAGEALCCSRGVIVVHAIAQACPLPARRAASCAGRSHKRVRAHLPAPWRRLGDSSTRRRSPHPQPHRAKAAGDGALQGDGERGALRLQGARGGGDAAFLVAQEQPGIAALAPAPASEGSAGRARRCWCGGGWPATGRGATCQPPWHACAPMIPGARCARRPVACPLDARPRPKRGRPPRIARQHERRRSPAAPTARGDRRRGDTAGARL